MFGRVLRGLRTEAGLTAASLATSAGLSQSYVTRLELGSAPPTPAAMDALASALGCDPMVLYAAAEIVPPAVARAFGQTPELMLLVAAMPQNERHRLYQNLVHANPRRDPARNPEWEAAERRRKALRKKLTK